ncbi:MAG: hypothetical protein WCV50_05145 [Patescibacteria group bacterium]|jgi:hypothetical protein
MLPITDIIYNQEYAKRLYNEEGIFEDAWLRIITIGADFEKIYEAHINNILELIEKYSGYSWEEQAEDYIPIYMVYSAPSFAHPLTLTVNEEPLAMLEDFIRQLSHRNMYFGFPTQELSEKSLGLVTSHVMSDLKLKKLPQSDWDLKKKTIKKYLNR